MLQEASSGAAKAQWSLRYAPHVGYAPPDRLLFRSLAGDDRADHVRFAAAAGMGGILYPWAGDSPAEERSAVRAALRDTGLECGCIVATPLSAIMDPVWVTGGADVASKLLGYVKSALHTASELGSATLAVLIRGDPQTSSVVQRRTALGRLRAAADLAASQGVVLGIEPMIELPDMLLRTFAEAVELVQSAAHPAVKLIFDTGHVTRMGDPLLTTYRQAYEQICILQLADMPDRVEPGAGKLELVPLLAHAIRRGYRGLVDLEHDWLAEGAAGERAGIEKLRAMDAAALRVAAHV